MDPLLRGDDNFKKTNFRLTGRRRRSKILHMVMNPGVSKRIKSAFALTEGGSVAGVDDIITGMFKKEISPKIGHNAISAMRKTLQSKGLYTPPPKEKGMTRLDISLKTELDLKGIPGPTSERR